jgi:hypothetical protein
MINLAMLLPHIDGAGAAISIAPAALTFEEQLQAARDAAEADAAVAAEARLASQMEQISAAHAEELVNTRVKWTEEESASLASEILIQLEAAECRLADAVGAILAPFIETLLPRASVAQLHQTLVSALGQDLQQQITLRGPEDLVKALAAKLAASGADNIRIGGTAPELQAECNGMLAITRLADWCDSMREAENG